MTHNIPEAPVVISIPVPPGSTTINLVLVLRSLDSTKAGQPSVWFSPMACAAEVTEKSIIVPGGNLSQLGTQNVQPIGNLIIQPAIAGGGIYISQVEGTFSVVGETPSITVSTVNANPGDGPFSLEVESTFA